VLGKDAPESKVLNGVLVVTTGGAALVEVIAIPAALFLLVRDAPRYVTAGNIAMTLVAALPVVILAFVILALFGVFGTFHI
jgi:ABC-type Fe3+ transport system permease subunit